MRKLLLSLVLAATVAAGGAAAASAAPTEVKLTVGPKAQFVSPTTLLLPVTVTCPATFGSALLNIGVSQSDTGAQGNGGAFAPCTGNPEDETVVVEAARPPFAPGQAIANGQAVAGGQENFDIRRIQIVT
jgi:hypothetical protein